MMNGNGQKLTEGHQKNWSKIGVQNHLKIAKKWLKSWRKLVQKWVKNWLEISLKITRNWLKINFKFYFQKAPKIGWKPKKSLKLIEVFNQFDQKPPKTDRKMDKRFTKNWLKNWTTTARNWLLKLVKNYQKKWSFKLVKNDQTWSKNWPTAHQKLRHPHQQLVKKIG